MSRTYVVLSLCSFMIAGFFLWLATIFINVDSMTHEAYAQQAQDLVHRQAVGESRNANEKNKCDN